MSSVFPGYKHVDSFGPDEEYEDEIEECYLTLDLVDIDPTLVPNSTTYRLIGLDTPTPFLQLSRTIMKGTPQTLLGTQLIFKSADAEAEAEENVENEDMNGNAENDEEDDVAGPAPAQSQTLNGSHDKRAAPELMHVCNTKHRIRFREVKLKPKLKIGALDPSSSLRANTSSTSKKTSSIDKSQAQRSSMEGNEGVVLYKEDSEMQIVQEDSVHDPALDTSPHTNPNVEDEDNPMEIDTDAP